jgi:hypothetical protein
MARLNNGFLGNASGKIGNVVFSKWRRIFTARQYQPEIHDANSQAQQKQRTRMVALIEFLKPLNKTFIRSFNYSSGKKSTPWAMAIKENMPNVSTEGCISLENFSLGDPCLPKIDIIGAVYDPFIDQIQLMYQMPFIPKGSNDFPYIGISALGKYKTSGDAPSFDIRHLISCQPEGSWFGNLNDGVDESFYLNFWEGGKLWLILVDDDLEKHSSNPFQNISVPEYFEPAPLIDEFNTNVLDNLVPVDAITWEYKQAIRNWYLDYHIDFSKTHLKNPANFKLKIWAIGFINNNHYLSGPYEWDLQESKFEVILGEAGLPGSAICMYAIYNNKGVQVSRFNRFYINKGSNGVVYPYLQQIFDCNYSHPVSFQLKGNQCGFCGNLEELFSDFIELWEQGVIHDEPVEIPVAEFGLTIQEPVNGVMLARNFTRAEGNTFFYNIDQEALLKVVPNTGFALGNFTGADAADVVLVGDVLYKIQMSKARSLSAVFVPR